MKRALGWIVLCLFAASLAAALPKTYQVTGIVTALTGEIITIKKGDELWEIARDKDTKVKGELKIGGKVTIFYRMTAMRIEVK